MKKLFFFLVLLAISSSFIFGQSLTVKPSTKQLIKVDENQSLEQYFKKNAVSNSKATIWSSTMSSASGWVASYGTGSTINIPWTWLPDTSAAAPLFDDYVGSSLYMNSPTCTTGLFYIDANTPSFQNPPLYGTYNSILTNAVAINTSGSSAVAVKFYQLYYAYNADTTFIEVSSDNINWYSINVNPNMAVNTRTYGWKIFNISTWAANKTQVWIRFRFAAPEYSGGSQIYGGGYGWMIDDVELFVPQNNMLQVDRVTLHDGYTQIPSGLGRPMYYDADFTNIGALTQSHVKLHGVVIGTTIDSTSSDTTLLPNIGVTDWSLNDYFYTPPTTQGAFKVSSYLSSDSIARLSLDTFNINVVCNTCTYSRDNNKYTGSRWVGATGTTSDPYIATNRYQVNQDAISYGINCVVGNETKVGSKIKAVLYKYFAATGSRTIVAQSNNYYITAANIPTTLPMNNPPSISLPFTSNYTVQKDSSYYVGIQVFGGTDTVTMASDNTGIPQWEQTSLYFDPTANTWYIWNYGNVPAVMIRLVFDPSIGVEEITNSTVNLFSCMPNPASFSTKITYELKKNDKVNIIITDIMGRVVKNINQGYQTKGNYNLDIDLNSLTSGTYFCTIKTSAEKATEKLIIVK